MTAQQVKNKAGSIGKTIMNSNAWKAIITGLCALILGFLVNKGKELDQGIERTKAVPDLIKKDQKHDRWFIRHDSIQVIKGIKEELYKDSSRKNDKEMMKMLQKIYQKLNIMYEIVEHKKIKHKMDSVPILIISEPPSAEIKDPAYSKSLMERYPYATQFVIDSLLAGKK